ncbi:class I SAM-dependent DNA methyltransferase [Nonomuraea sp. NPDC049714]|uniref:class I SAM-dependent DNA methyltransferase n=1 Tax=Nonomuraea sp. NPDC049714 TaxID=3364357 RepID=UPI0037A7F0B5
MIEPDFVRTTRDSYDAVAAQYAEAFSATLETAPLQRAMLDAFAALVRGGGPVADVGCGPGYATGHLHALGVDAFGVDLAPEMIALARQAYPGLRFEVGTMAALDVPDGALGGVLSRYSIIHTPPERLPEIIAEFSRVLAPGGHLMLSFVAHDEPAEPAEAYDHRVALAYRWSPDRVAGLLGEHGLDEVARLVYAPGEDTVRGFPAVDLLTRKPAQAIAAAGEAGEAGGMLCVTPNALKGS